MPPAPDPTDMETHQQAHHPAPARPMSIAWGLSGMGHQNSPLNSTLFNFIAPGTMIPAPNGTSGHHSHLPYAPIAAGLDYGSEFVSPSSIQSCRHYDCGFPGHRDGTLSHGACTSKVLMPTGHVTNSLWVELDEAPEDNNPASASQPKSTPQMRRKKKEAHNVTEASQGGSSSAGAGAGALSLSDVAILSSTSRNSRTSINSKSTSMASTASSTWGRQRKLRSASRTSKNNCDKPNDGPEERGARASHNRIEKHYRNRLNAQFESFLILCRRKPDTMATVMAMISNRMAQTVRTAVRARVKCLKWLASVYKRWNERTMSSSARTSSFKAAFDGLMDLPPMARYPHLTEKRRSISISVSNNQVV